MKRKIPLAKAKTLDLSTLSDDERARVEKVLNGRNKVFSLRLRERDIDAWKASAKRKGESLTEWVERVLNTAAAREDAARAR